MTDRCSIRGCRNEPALDYLGHGICDDHWAALGPAALRTELGINADEMSAKEEPMAKRKIPIENTATTEVPPAAPDFFRSSGEMTRAPKRTRAKLATIENVAQPAAEMAPATKEPSTKRRRKTTAEAAPEETAREKAKADPAEPEAPKPELVVFAFRLTQAERDAIHQTAGPRNATQFVRRVAVAFASEDEAAFKTVLKEAKTLRS